jgi:hypothetical protein
VLEVVLRWDDEILDIVHVTDRCEIAGVELIRDGQPVVPHAGRIGLVDYSISKIELPARTVPYTRVDDTKLLPYLAVVLATHLVVLAIAMRHGHPTDRIAHHRRAVHLGNFVGTTYAPGVLTDDDSKDEKQPGEGVPMSLEAGEVGDVVEKQDGHVAVAKTPSKPAVTREVGRDELDKYIALVDNNPTTSGFDRMNVNAPLYGGQDAGAGQFGLAYDGKGQGGGGNSPGTIGVAQANAFSNGRSAGDGWGGHNAGGDSIAIGQHWDFVAVEICDHPYTDHCEPSPFARHIRRRSLLRDCYKGVEKEILEVELGEMVDTVDVTGKNTELAACVKTALEQQLDDLHAARFILVFDR